MNELAFAVLLGAAAAAVIGALRAIVSEIVDLNLWMLSQSAAWLLFNKPLSCDLCMSVWTALGLAFATRFDLLGFLGAISVSMLVLGALRPRVGS